MLKKEALQSKGSQASCSDHGALKPCPHLQLFGLGRLENHQLMPRQPYSALCPVYQQTLHVPLGWRAAPTEASKGRTSGLRRCGQFREVWTYSQATAQTQALRSCCKGTDKWCPHLVRTSSKKNMELTCHTLQHNHSWNWVLPWEKYRSQYRPHQEGCQS